VDTINPASVAIGFNGVDDAGAECVLCDHPINYLYVLHLNTVEGRAVTFAPVGSSCIRTWADSLPHSEAQAAILARLKVAEEEAEKIKASFRAFNAQAKYNHITSEDRDALVRFLGAPPAIRSNPFLSDVAAKVEQYSGWASDRQRGAWLAALGRELAKVGGKPLVLAAPAADPRLSPEDADLLTRAAKLISDEVRFLKLDSVQRDALKDIHAKVTRYGSFASPAQRGFFASIIKRGEGSGRVANALREGKTVTFTATLPPLPADLAAQKAVGEVPNDIEEYDGEVPF
jgi:hypothetical protein